MPPEDDAKDKWCPFKRVAMSEGMAANWTGNMAESGDGYANIFKETRCIGRACMMWRWHHVDPDLGHCGLAGDVFAE